LKKAVGGAGGGVPPEESGAGEQAPEVVEDDGETDLLSSAEADKILSMPNFKSMVNVTSW